MKNKVNNVPQVLFNGFKNSEIVFTDIPGYRDYMLWLEYDPDVVSYFQPRMDLILGRQQSKPDNLKIDFWVNRRNGTSEFIHIHDDEQIDPYILPQAIGCAAAVDTVFSPVRLNEILQEPRRSNLETLWNYARREIRAIHLAYLTKFFKMEYYPTVSGLGAFLNSNGLPPDLAYTLLFRRAALADLVHFPLTGDSIIFHNAEFVHNISENTAGQQSFLDFELWRGFDPKENFENF